MIYLDSSALVKLAVTEPGSAALIEWLGHSANLVRVSSPIVRVEVPRAVWRADPGSLPQAYAVVRRVRDIRITASVLTRAAGARPVTLRALDAIHLASALTIRHDLTALVSYDKWLLAAAQEAGLPTAARLRAAARAKRQPTRDVHRANRQPPATRTGPTGSRPRRAPGGFSLIGLTSLARGVAVPVDTAEHPVWFTVNGGLAWPARPSPELSPIALS